MKIITTPWTIPTGPHFILSQLLSASAAFRCQLYHRCDFTVVVTFKRVCVVEVVCGWVIRVGGPPAKGPSLWHHHSAQHQLVLLGYVPSQCHQHRLLHCLAGLKHERKKEKINTNTRTQTHTNKWSNDTGSLQHSVVNKSFTTTQSNYAERLWLTVRPFTVLEKYCSYLVEILWRWCVAAHEAGQ